ncbi:MAG: sulfatase [Myxococcales bacterium]|nr:sulfatase [Myxococcales bacterium]
MFSALERTFLGAALLATSSLGLLSGACSEQSDSRAGTTPSASVAVAAPSASAQPTPPPKPEPKRPYNVLFIMIDSLRADMPWAGYPRQIAPWLSKFAKRSTLYPRSYSISSYTAKSVAPTLTGKYGTEMARDGYFFTKWLPSNLFISERAQAEGHRTLAGNAHGYFLPVMGLNQGFDDYRLLPGTILDTTGVNNITSEDLNKLAKEMLSGDNVKQANDKRFFAYFHFLDPHYTYFKHDGHPDYGNKRRDLYDNEVHYSDKWVGDLVDWVYEQPWGKDTAVIITADHGEGFGEHGHYRHAYEIWEGLVRVPLFIHVPGAEPRRIEEPRGAIDLAPTMADLMGLKDDPPFRGKSLLPEVFGGEVEKRRVIVDLPRCDLMDKRRALIDGDLKLLSFGDDQKFMLYDVVKDPKEEHELSTDMPEEFERMKKEYLEESAKIPNVPAIGGVPLKGDRLQQRY